MTLIATLIARGAILIAGIALTGILALVSAQIGMRVFIGQPLSWPDELSRILFIYLVFIGAAETSVRHKHIAVNMQDTFGLPAAADRVLDLIRMALCIVVLAVIAWGAWQMVPVVSTMQLPATKLKMSIMVYPVLIGSVAMIAALALNIVALLTGQRLLPDEGDDPYAEAEGN